MKSTVSEKPCEANSEKPCEANSEKPCLMKDKRDGQIFLAYGDNKTVSLTKGDGTSGYSMVGEPFEGEGINLVHFHGSVCIEND